MRLLSLRLLAYFGIASLCLVAVLPQAAYSTPLKVDNLDGTGTVSWNFTAADDYTLDNVSLSQGAAILSTYESYWLRDSVLDFSNYFHMSNVNISDSGELSLEIGELVEMVLNGNFTDPDDGDSNNYSPWAFEKSGNSTADQEYRSISFGHLDDGYCWRNWHVDNSVAVGHALSIWLNQTVNLTTNPMALNTSAFHRFDNQSHQATPGLNASLLLTHLDSGASTVLATTGWYNSTDAAYRPLWSNDTDMFSGTGLYNISLLTIFDTTGKASDITSTAPAGMLHYWDDISLRYTAYSQAGTYVSEVFDAGSYAMWKNISWEQDLPPGTGIELLVRAGNSSVPTDSIWSEWSQPIADYSGSSIDRPMGRYLQYRVEMSTSDTSQTPYIRYMNITYEKYRLDGIAETRDFKPDGLVRWGYISHKENVRGQGVNYQYSLDSGSSWADIPEALDLREADASTPSGIRFRVLLNTADTVITPEATLIQLTYVSKVPAFTLEPLWSQSGASPGETVRLNIHFNNTVASISRIAWLNVYLDSRLEYEANNSQALGTLSGFITDSNPNIRKFVFSSLSLGQNSLWIDANINPGVMDGDLLQTTVTLDYEDPMGSRVESLLRISQLRVNGPLMSAKIATMNGTADVGDTLFYRAWLNNTGQGEAVKIWVNSTLDERLNGQNISLEFQNIPGDSSQSFNFNATMGNNVAQGSSVPMKISIEYSDSAGHIRALETEAEPVGAMLRSKFDVVLISQQIQAKSRDMIVLTVHYNNTGYGAARSVKLTYLIPKGLDYVSSSATPIVSSGKCYWEFNDVGPGSHSFTVTMRLQVLDEPLFQTDAMHVELIVDDLVEGQKPVMNSNSISISIERIYTLWEKIYWPWSGLAIGLAMFFSSLGLWYFFKPIPPSIDDVFVLYKDGRLITHRQPETAESSGLDGDLVGAMLTAVQQFITDSLSNGKSDRVKKLEFGEKELFLERGENINLAVVYTGSMNKKLQAQMLDITHNIESIHPELVSWDGRMRSLDDITPLIDGLIGQWQS